MVAQKIPRSDQGGEGKLAHHLPLAHSLEKLPQMRKSSYTLIHVSGYIIRKLNQRVQMFPPRHNVSPLRCLIKGPKILRLIQHTMSTIKPQASTTFTLK